MEYAEVGKCLRVGEGGVEVVPPRRDSRGGAVVGVEGCWALEDVFGEDLGDLVVGSEGSEGVCCEDEVAVCGVAVGDLVDEGAGRCGAVLADLEDAGWVISGEDDRLPCMQHLPSFLGVGSDQDGDPRYLTAQSALRGVTDGGDVIPREVEFQAVLVDVVLYVDGTRIP